MNARLLLVVFSLLSSAGAAWACECKSGSPESKPETAEALFEATVTEVKESGDDWLVKVDVGRAWKGVTPRQQLTLRARTGKRCGYYFAAGKTYFVSAMKDGDGHRVSTCGLTKPIEQAGPIIEKLARPPK